MAIILHRSRFGAYLAENDPQVYETASGGNDHVRSSSDWLAAGIHSHGLGTGIKKKESFTAYSEIFFIIPRLMWTTSFFYWPSVNQFLFIVYLPWMLFLQGSMSLENPMCGIAILRL